MSNIKKFNEEWDNRIDSLFLQEISDRLYGPDSESYMAAIKELNKTHRKREGRVGAEFFDSEIERKRKAREKDIVNQFK
jgi:hypothetical protein